MPVGGGVQVLDLGLGGPCDAINPRIDGVTLSGHIHLHGLPPSVRHGSVESQVIDDDVLSPYLPADDERGDVREVGQKFEGKVTARGVGPCSRDLFDPAPVRVEGREIDRLGSVVFHPGRHRGGVRGSERPPNVRGSQLARPNADRDVGAGPGSGRFHDDPLFEGCSSTRILLGQSLTSNEVIEV